MSIITRNQNTINSRLAKFSPDAKFDISQWVPLPSDIDRTDMTCINAEYKQCVDFTKQELKERRPDERKAKPVSQCICGVHINGDYAQRIWNPEHDKTVYANLGQKCYGILFEGMSSDQKKKYNHYCNRLNDGSPRSKIRPVHCLECHKSHKSIHLTYASGEFINYHIKCMSIQMMHAFNETYSHYGVKQTIGKCSICSQYKFIKDMKRHKSIHIDFIVACNYKLEYKKHRGKTLLQVHNNGNGDYIQWLENNITSNSIKKTITTFMDGIEDGLEYSNN